MSMPTVPDVDPKITISTLDALNIVIASVGLEEIALSHILNAEGEKIQSVLGTLEGQCPKNPSVEDLTQINDSVNETLRNIIKKEMLLEFKLEEAVTAVKKAKHKPKC